MVSCIYCKVNTVLEQCSKYYRTVSGAACWVEALCAYAWHNASPGSSPGLCILFSYFDFFYIFLKVRLGYASLALVRVQVRFGVGLFCALM